MMLYLEYQFRRICVYEANRQGDSQKCYGCNICNKHIPPPAKQTRVPKVNDTLNYFNHIHLDPHKSTQELLTHSPQSFKLYKSMLSVSAVFVFKCRCPGFFCPGFFCPGFIYFANSVTSLKINPGTLNNLECNVSPKLSSFTMLVNIDEEKSFDERIRIHRPSSNFLTSFIKHWYLPEERVKHLGWVKNLTNKYW